MICDVALAVVTALIELTQTATLEMIDMSNPHVSGTVRKYSRAHADLLH